jgi:MSHA biogenesis protein MshN
MADELSVVTPSAPSPASTPAARSEPRPVAAKPPVTPATEKRLAAEKPEAAKPATAPGRAAEPVVKTRIDKQERIPTAAERAEAEYQRAAAARRQGSLDAALAGYRSALEYYPEHAGARQGLAAQLIDARRYDEAEDVLRKGTEIAPTRLSSTLALARLKVERNQVAAALELLQKNAAAGEASAEFQGFTGALLNRAGRSAEAVERYRHAARLSPGEGRWWAGLGIALDASGKPSEARDAYLRARQSPDLPPDLAQHVDQRLR